MRDLSIELSQDSPSQALVADEWLFARMKRGVEKVEERMVKAAQVLGDAGIDYAVIGGNAVAAWVATKDESAVRNTRDVDVMMRQVDLPRAILAMESAGFVHRYSAGISMFLDEPGGKALDAVHVILQEESLGNPNLDRVVPLRGVKIMDLESLVRIKLAVWRRKDQVHVLDLISVGLIDSSLLPKLPPDLAKRPQELLDNPE